MRKEITELIAKLSNGLGEKGTGKWPNYGFGHKISATLIYTI